MAALAVFASLLTLTAASAAAAPPLPANTGCETAAVVAKLGVVEDRAAANMLAEALRSLTKGGERCLLDAGDPSENRVPAAATRREATGASEIYVVGGPAAISDAWLRSTLGVSSWVRIAGSNRWETQRAVAEAIISLEGGESVSPYMASASSPPTLPPNTGCDSGAVIVKLGVVEDRAAANMLAEALSSLTIASTRCLVDVGNPGAGAAPSASATRDARQAEALFVIGGPAAIPDTWLNRYFGDIEPQRVAGTDRWHTQAQVAAQIVRLASEFRQQYGGPQATVE